MISESSTLRVVLCFCLVTLRLSGERCVVYINSIPKLGMSGKSNLSSSVSRYIPVERRSEFSVYCLEHTDPDRSDIVSGLILRGPLDIFLAFLTSFLVSSTTGFTSFFFTPNSFNSVTLLSLAYICSIYSCITDGSSSQTVARELMADLFIANRLSLSDSSFIFYYILLYASEKSLANSNRSSKRFIGLYRLGSQPNCFKSLSAR